MASLIQSLGNLLNDDEGIAVLERKLADARSAAAQALAKLHAAEAALSAGHPEAVKVKAKAARDVATATAIRSDFESALTTARATRAA
jgi:hypothetical protein